MKWKMINRKTWNGVSLRQFDVFPDLHTIAQIGLDKDLYNINFV